MMLKESRYLIIEIFINAYNNFDVEGMLCYCHNDIEFSNISRGETTLYLRGIEALRKQAVLAKEYFIKREQQIKSLESDHENIVAYIEFTGTLANGLAENETISFTAKSIYTFKNNKIIELKDISN